MRIATRTDANLATLFYKTLFVHDAALQSQALGVFWPQNAHAPASTNSALFTAALCMLVGPKHDSTRCRCAAPAAISGIPTDLPTSSAWSSAILRFDTIRTKVRQPFGRFKMVTLPEVQVLLPTVHAKFCIYAYHELLTVVKRNNEEVIEC